jgi:hypothetical protein
VIEHGVKETEYRVPLRVVSRQRHCHRFAYACRKHLILAEFYPNLDVKITPIRIEIKRKT